jgi:hypothetical protein
MRRIHNMKNDWLDRAKKRLHAKAKEPSGVLLERLQVEGILNDRFEVTGKVHRWDAFLAITAVKYATDRIHADLSKRGEKNYHCTPR